MSLSTALNNSLSGLNAATRQVDVTANNIANATTEGYARRSVDQSALTLNGAGSGVIVDGVSVATNEPLTNDRRRAEAALAGQTILTDGFGELASLIGGVDDPGSFFNRYEGLESSLRRLADEPESSAAQLDAVARAKDVAAGLNAAQDGLLEMRTEVDEEIARQVDRLNDALAELNRLNGQVERDVASGRDAAETIAARQTVVDQIADIVPIKTKLDSDNRLRVFTAGGAALVDLSAATFEFTPSPVFTPDLDYRNSVGGLSGLTLNGIDVTPGTTAYGGMDGGSLGALFELRDGAGVTFQNRIDSLAADLIDRFDDPAVEPFITPGDPGLFTDAGGAVSGAPGLAGRIAVNTAVDPDAGGDIWMIRDGIGAAAPGDAGDNTHAIALLDAFTAVNPAPAASGVGGDKSATDLIADFSSLVSTEAESAETVQAMRAARFDSLSKAEAIAIGVDLDVELQNLTLIENAYSANAQVLRVIDELFDVLLQT